MSERILICVAWPYANGSLHLGHVAGTNLPADIFARYHRLKGNEVVMVSGSDSHGTPVTLKAEQEAKTPREIAGFYQPEFLDCWRRLGISFDLFTTTDTENHTEVTRDIFLRLLEKGYLEKRTVSQTYCPSCQKFLPDRYVEGECPHCGDLNARGDQCDACGKLLDAPELKNPRCRTCGIAAEFRDSEQFFLLLSAFQQQLSAWAENQKQWRPNVFMLTQRYLKEGLRDRAITRDIDWGVPVPLEGYGNKRIYVWFEAVIGYLSATKEWAKSAGDSEKWRLFWEGNRAKSYYFMGKDNIPFHTLIWPAMLMGYGGLNLPYDIPANEFLTIEGRALSTSRNWAVWVPDYLERYDPDSLRYFLSINMPETSDTDFSWREFVRRNNDELVATYGNLVNRVLTFTYRNFDGCVPESGEIDDQSRVLLKKADDTLASMDGLLAGCHFREATRSAMALAHEANRYLDEKSPWKTIKEDKQSASTALFVALSVISCLKTVLYPFLPFSSQKVHEYLGFKGKVEDFGWKRQELALGQQLLEPKPLFVKLDEKLVEEETSRIGQAS
ncbi:methionine--tRNA ligase [Chloroflexota bacterium]